MELQKATIIRSTDKKGTHTANSEYVFHFSSYPAHRNISLYEGRFIDRSENKSLHYHKIMNDEEYILKPNDTIIIPPLVVHGFRAKISDSRLQFVSTDITDRQEFFLGLAKIINRKIVLNEEELEAFYNRHDQYSVK